MILFIFGVKDVFFMKFYFKVRLFWQVFVAYVTRVVSKISRDSQITHYVPSQRLVYLQSSNYRCDNSSMEMLLLYPILAMDSVRVLDFCND